VVSPPQFDPDPIFTPDDIVGGSSPDPGDEGADEANEGAGTTTPPSSTPTLRCWAGWKEVAKGWTAIGWRVEKRERADRVVYCAKRVTPPTDPVVPAKPGCAGGKLVVLKTLPPRWSCVCPEGETRQRTGKHSYACKGSPGGGTHSDPKKDCLKKGWKWTRKGCVNPDTRCPKGYVGQPPNCRKPPRCPRGYIGAPPNCLKLPPPRCPRGYVGKPPNCRKLLPPGCPKGYIGKPPKCTKVTFNKSPDGLKDVKKQFRNLKGLRKD
jgi:hypothetical protein